MATVKLVNENCDHLIVKRVFADIKATKKIASRISGAHWPAIRNISSCAGRASKPSCSRARSIC